MAEDEDKVTCICGTEKTFGDHCPTCAPEFFDALGVDVPPWQRAALAKMAKFPDKETMKKATGLAKDAVEFQLVHATLKLGSEILFRIGPVRRRDVEASLGRAQDYLLEQGYEVELEVKKLPEPQWAIGIDPGQPANLLITDDPKPRPAPLWWNFWGK